MSTVRTPEDICFLCEVNKATATNSHFTPASLIASCIGKRNYEDSKRIETGGKVPLDSYYGSANLSNSDPTIKQHHHAADYIFCPTCEKNLSVLETEINPFLTKSIKDANQKVNLPETALGQIKYITCNRVDTKLLFLYFYSVIWRQALQQRLDKGVDVLRKHEEQFVHKCLKENLRNDLKEMLAREFEVVPLIVVTADNFADPDYNLIMPHSKFINPYCFCANEFLIIIDFSYPPPMKSGVPFFNLERLISKKELLNISLKELFKIAIVPQKEWRSFLKATSDHEAAIFTNHYAKLLSDYSGLNIMLCHYLLHNCAQKRHRVSTKLYAQDFYDCYLRMTHQA
jgi:hypothetical protein